MFSTKSVRIALVVAASVVSLLVVTACGDKTNDYRGQIIDIEKKYQPKLKSLEGKINKDGGDPQKVAADLKQLSTLATSFADDVAKLKAPAGKEKLGQDLVAAERDISAAALTMRKAMLKGDVDATSKAGSALIDADAAEQKAIAALNNASD